MSKNLPDGEYIPLGWDGTPEYEVIKGHVSESEAKEALKSYYGDDIGDWTLQTEHAYARWVPDSTGDYDMNLRLVYPSAKSKRGAFKVTLVTDRKLVEPEAGKRES